MLSAGRCQPVIPGFAIALRSPPERRDPAAILQSVQGGVQGAVFNLEDVVRTTLNGMRDGVTVGRAENQRLEDQHVESSLHHLALNGGFAPWHIPQYTPVDDLPVN